MSDEKATFDKEVRSLPLSKFIEVYNKADTGLISMKKDVLNRVYMDYNENWLVEQYIKYISSGFDPKITSTFQIFKSSFRRIEKLYYMVSRLHIKTKFYNMIIFRLKLHTTNRWYNYGFMYCRVIGDEVISDYITTGINITSMDGEYRNRFSHQNIINYLKNTYRKLWEMVDDYIVNRISKGELEISFNTYFHTDNESITNKIIEYVNGERINISLLIISWICENVLRYQQIQYGPDIDNYTVHLCRDEDMDEMKNIVKEVGIEEIQMFYIYAKNYILAQDAINYKAHEKIPLELCPYGQKIIPLSQIEYKFPFDIRYRTWREYYICRLVSDLVINSICGGFSVMWDWFFVNNVDINMFDNTNMIELVSNVSNKKIFSAMNRARVVEYDKNKPACEGKNEYDEFVEVVDKKIKHVENQRKQFSNGINAEYAISSGKALCLISENTGRTIGNAFYLDKSTEYKTKHGSIISSYGHMAKYLFDIIYSLYCINSRLGIIQADLHLGNATINNTYNSWAGYTRSRYNVREQENDIEIYKVAKVSGSGKESKFGSEELYSFRHIAKIGTIIDFSRSLINHPKFKEENIEKIIAYYMEFFPNVVLDYVKFKKLVSSDFDTVYKIFSAFDSYYHTYLLLQYIKINNIDQNVESLELMTNINKIARSYLVDKMKLFIDGKLGHLEYPNYDVIVTCFAKHKIKNVPEYFNVADIFDFTKPLAYSIYNWNKLPPRFKQVVLKKDNDEITVKSNNVNQIKEWYKIQEKINSAI
jgi:hypothetical protein